MRHPIMILIALAACASAAPASAASDSSSATSSTARDTVPSISLPCPPGDAVVYANNNTWMYRREWSAAFDRLRRQPGGERGIASGSYTCETTARREGFKLAPGSPQDDVTTPTGNSALAPLPQLIRSR